jgi:hypothetical protein
MLKDNKDLKRLESKLVAEEATIRIMRQRKGVVKYPQLFLVEMTKRMRLHLNSEQLAAAENMIPAYVYRHGRGT